MVQSLLDPRLESLNIFKPNFLNLWAKDLSVDPSEGGLQSKICTKWFAGTSRATCSGILSHSLTHEAVLQEVELFQEKRLLWDSGENGGAG